MMKRLANIISYCVVAVVIAGCASSSPTHFYTLDPTPVPAVAMQADYAVSVAPVSVPAFIDRQQIVLRTGPNKVFVDEYNLWASPLKDDIRRVVIEDLVSVLGTMQVMPSSQISAVGAKYRVTIDILRFDSELGKGASLDALWAVNAAKGGQSGRGRTTITETVQGDDYAALVAAHSRALDGLSAAIAKKIQEMEGQKP
jgi:uncharacterized protein